MAKMNEVLMNLMGEKNPDSDIVIRRIALRLNTTYHDVKQVYLNFKDSIDIVTALREELEITRAERNGFRAANQIFEHERAKETALPTSAEWRRADRISLAKMNFLEGYEMTVGDYHTLMGH